MNISIRGVADSKDHDKERLILDVTGTAELGKYLVLDTTYTGENKVSNKARHVHWFLDQSVKEGDVILLYTKAGKDTSQAGSKAGTTTYIRYWGLDSSVWNNTGDAAVLIRAAEWDFKKVK